MLACWRSKTGVLAASLAIYAPRKRNSTRVFPTISGTSQKSSAKSLSKAKSPRTFAQVKE